MAGLMVDQAPGGGVGGRNAAPTLGGRGGSALPPSPGNTRGRPTAGPRAARLRHSLPGACRSTPGSVVLSRGKEARPPGAPRAEDPAIPACSGGAPSVRAGRAVLR